MGIFLQGYYCLVVGVSTCFVDFGFKKAIVYKKSLAFTKEGECVDESLKPYRLVKCRIKSKNEANKIPSPV
jgi:hypothetical protein